MARSPARLLLFDPYVGGHHADHVRWLAEGWLRRDIPGTLVAAVPGRMTDEHPELRALEDAGEHGRFKVAPLASEARPSDLFRSAIANARLLRTAVQATETEKVLALYLDHLQPALALRAPVGGAPVSGILFRPTLHYGRFDEASPGVAQRMARYRKGLLLGAALRNPLMRSVLTLDPTAVESIQRLAPRHVRCEWLPDPVDFGVAGADPQTVRTQFGVAPGRTLLLLFGALDERKGVMTVLRAIQRLPPEVSRGLTLLLAGQPSVGMRELLTSAVEGARAVSEAQIILHAQYVPDADVQNLVAASDVILAPYRRHVGSSGVIMRAAAAGKPVLSQDYGLMGWQVRHHRLGITVDTERDEAVARALATLAAEPDAYIDRDHAREFVGAHTVDTYVETVLTSLGIGTLAGWDSR